MIYFGIFLAAVSLAAFILYGADKSKARRGAWRIPEKVLLSLSFFGGAAGGLLGMVLFRHKIRKGAFRLVIPAALALQAALLLWVWIRR